MSKLLEQYRKQILALLGLILIVVSLSTYITYKQLSDSLTQTYFSKLSVLKNSLAMHIKDYFTYNEKVLLTLAQGGVAQEALEGFDQAFTLAESEYPKGHNPYSLKKEIYDYTQKVNYGIPKSTPKRKIDGYIPIKKSGQILQSLYIADNPLGTHNKSQLYASNKNLSYDRIHKKYHRYFLDQLNQYGFYDIFLINMEGDIVYTVSKEHDFATNLQNGIYANSPLSKVYKKALQSNTIVFSDFSAYEPSYNKPAAFMAVPLYRNGKKSGILAVQLSNDEINNVLTFNESQKEVGLGESGEAYLVGNDHYMRSNSRFLSQVNNPLVNEFSTTVGIIKVNSDSVQRALSGKNSHQIMKDYRGVEVFSSYTPIEILGQKWALLVEIDSREVYTTINQTTKIIIITSIVLTLLFLTLLSYMFLQLILKPIERQEALLAENIRLKSKELNSSRSLLDEYKRAVDISSIVSKTTPQGIITYVNDAFCEISGYSREELIGRSHNMIRHPDMPKEVFEDLWETILKKWVWHGSIKNLKKGGGVYYVSSTIVPIMDENDTIKEFISIRSDISELVKKNEQIITQTTDSVTSLPNRQKLIESINQHHGEMKLAIIQIDKFKEINDFYGIDTGDTLLINIASVLKQLLDEKKVSFYKINGDEFAVFESNNMPMHDFNKKLTNIIKYFDYNVILAEEDHFNISITVGIAIGETERLLFDAEMILRKAVESSKSILSYESSHEIEKTYQENITMTTKIKEAIKNDDITIFIQPIYSNTNKTKEKFECLVRMKDGDKVISPFFFLNIAKKARLYPTITKIVIEKSFDYFKDADSVFSINLDIEDILNNNLVSFLKRRIKEYRIRHRVVIEIVESEGIENFEDVHTFIREVKEFGCKIAIDDFGTGYSNFEYLMKLNVDYIKIDGSLIKDIDKNPNSQIIVELIVDFAKRMNIETIAEFVHSDEVYQKVKSLGIDFSQGYYLGEPQPINF